MKMLLLDIAVEQQELPIVKALLTAGARRRLGSCTTDPLAFVRPYANELPVDRAIRLALLGSVPAPAGHGPGVMTTHH